MMERKPLKNLKTSPGLPADREQQLLALLLSCYSDVHQKLQAHPEAFDDALIQWAQTLGLGIAPQHDGYELRGMGLPFRTELNQFSSFAHEGMDFHILSFLSFFHKEIQIHCISETYGEILRNGMAPLGWVGNWSEETLHLHKESEPKATQQKMLFKPEDFIKRNHRLWHGIPLMEELAFEEKYSVRNQLIQLAHTWGFDVVIDNPQNLQNLSELERRLLKLRGGMKKQNTSYTFKTPLKMRKRALPLFADTQLSAALCTAVILAPGSGMTLENVMVSSSKSHFFQLAKKLGATIEVVNKKESLGEHYSNVKVKYTQDLFGKKIAGESFLQSVDEIPLLAILAAFAEGETVIRGFEMLPGQGKTILHILKENLKKTGVEIGEFEEGLVIRGRPELDGANFDAHGIPSLTLAFDILSRVTKGEASIENPNLLIQSKFHKILEEAHA